MNAVKQFLKLKFLCGVILELEKYFGAETKIVKCSATEDEPIKIN